jgi:hypothetical protein
MKTRSTLAWILSISLLTPFVARAELFQSTESSSNYDAVFSRPFDISARAGFFDYNRRDKTGDTNPLLGFAIDWNASEVVGTPSPVYYGTSSGLSFTRVNGLNDSSNLFLVPVNVLLGYRFTDTLLAAAHTGVNIYIQDSPEVLDVGDGTGNLEVFPNFGFNGAWSFSNQFALTAAIDWTLTDRSDPFIGTVGVAIPLG